MSHTPAMLRELRCIEKFGEPTDLYEWHGARALAFYAREKVLTALVTRGLIRHEVGGMVVTDEGRAAIAKATGADI